MSIKIMSAIFETEFRDLPTGEQADDGRNKMAKASSVKIVMLAIADHANDEGEGSYPGLTRLSLKTGLSRQGIVDVQKACKYNGLLFVADEPSKLGTNNYTINIECFPILKDVSQVTLLVKPLDYPGQATLPEAVKPLDLNHQYTNEPSNGVPPTYAVEWQIAGQSQTVIIPDEFDAKTKDAANLISTGLGSLAELGYSICMAFMQTRRIAFTDSQIKGQRKAVRDLIKAGVYPRHVRDAVEKLISEGMTVTDLYSVTKTAISLANPPPETTGYNPQGLTIS